MEHVNVMAVISVQPEHVSKVRVALAALAEKSRHEQGCLRYELFQRANAPVLVTQELWVNAAAVDAHMQGVNVAEAVALVTPFLSNPPEIHQYSQIM